jgi:hypothetical protein
MGHICVANINTIKRITRDSNRYYKKAGLEVKGAPVLNSLVNHNATTDVLWAWIYRSTFFNLGR